MNLEVGVSARHMHIKREDFRKLFGEEELTKKKDLSQPGEFASNEFISIKTKDGVIENIRLLGPFRKYNQIELAFSDARKLKITPPVRNSGDLDNSNSITVIGPKGEIYLDNAVIIATRHIHMTPKDFEKVNKNKVDVYFNTEKPTIFKDVDIKVSENYKTEIHIDVDDANALLVKADTVATIL